MLLPEGDYNTTRQRIVGDHICGRFQNGAITCPCPNSQQQYPSITLHFPTFSVQVDQSAYFFKVLLTQSNGICYVLMGPYAGTDLVLGTLFLKQFYVQYDYEKKRVGMARAVLSVIVDETGKGVQLEWWGWFMLAMLVVAFVVCLGMVKKVVRGRKGGGKKRGERE